jgi:hypothetical protein
MTSVDKYTMIALVRRAQSERDPRKKDGLWQMIREKGPVRDATMIKGDVIGREGMAPDAGR